MSDDSIGAVSCLGARLGVMEHNEAAPDADLRTVRTLARGLEILDLFVGGNVLTQSEVSARSGLPLPTVHRMVVTLIQRGYLEAAPGVDRALRVGPAVGRLAPPATEGERQAVLRRALLDLSEATGETVNLATLVGASIVYLDGVAGSKLLTPKAVIGTLLPAHCTALGKALLAQLSDEDVLELLGAGPYDRLTDRTVGDWPTLRDQLDVVRASGIAISNQEFEVGLVAMAVPVAIGEGPLLAVNVSLPSARATDEFRAELAELLQETFADR